MFWLGLVVGIVATVIAEFATIYIVVNMEMNKDDE